MLVTLPLVIPSYVGALAMLGSSGNGGLVSLASMRSVCPSFRCSPASGRPGARSACGTSPTSTSSPPRPSAGWTLPSRRQPAVWVHPHPRTGRRRRPPPTAAGAPQLLAARRPLRHLGLRGGVAPPLRDLHPRHLHTVPGQARHHSGALPLRHPGARRPGPRHRAEQRNRGRAASLARNGPRAHPPRGAHGRPAVAAYAFLSTVVIGRLVLPLVTLGWWAVAGHLTRKRVRPVWAEAGRSAGVALAAAAAATAVAALPVAILTVRHPSRSGPDAGSGELVDVLPPPPGGGLGFLVLSIRYAPAVYQTVVLLVIAYVAMFLPQALVGHPGRTAPGGTSLEEASRSLGSGGLGSHPAAESRSRWCGDRSSQAVRWCSSPS
jgi:iron(III) transport system permease protein